MPHSLKVRLKNLQRKGELTDKDIDRIFKALEQEPTEEQHKPHSLLDAYFQMKAESEQEPCDDVVSRQAVLDTEYQIKEINGIEYVMLSEVQMKMRKLPSVRPKSETVTEFADRCRECGAKLGNLLKQKTGHWIGIDEEPHEVWECDHCRFVIDGSGCIDPYDYLDTYKYCPNCGAKMVESQESEG